MVAELSITEAPKPDPKICDPGGKGMIFPLLESEQNWQNGWRAVLYAMALCYIFLGVNVVANKFMDAIEMITSKKMRVKNKETGRIVTVQRWNDTMANLTLLALGSSAPEILLSIMEICLSGFHSGALGPSTIVGSAAFNLFVIVAVCIYAVDSSETRSIKEYSVFLITAIFSIIAYLWLVVIVQLSSPDVVEPWEGVSTLLMFPALLIISYMADIGYFRKTETTLSVPSTATEQIDQEGGARHGIEEACQVIRDQFGNAISNPPGVLSFAEDTMEVLATDQIKTVKIPVLRRNGIQGSVTCRYRFDNRAGTAIPERDYAEGEGEIVFGPGEEKQEIDVTILRKQPWERADSFQVILDKATGGALFNPNDDGGDAACILTVKIRNGHGQPPELTNRVMGLVDGAINVDRTCLGCSLWKADIVHSIVDAGAEDGERASFVDTLIHLICVPWKLAFSLLIPPAEYCGGWICFIISLVHIGGLTLVIIDFAELFGCVTSIDDSITAITFVALGTSMPDLFASKTAACQDPTADASICNVTGSNSVNVFLGIGLPWTIAAIYWEAVPPTRLWLSNYGADFLGRYPDGVFVVKGGDLGFSVVVFLIGALMAFGILRLRRVYVGGELGGPAGLKLLSAVMLVLLWIFYIALSVWKVQNPGANVGLQLFAIIVAIVVLENTVLVIGGVMKLLGLFGGKSAPSCEADVAALEEGTACGGLEPSARSGDDEMYFHSIYHLCVDEYRDAEDEDEDEPLSFAAAFMVCLAITKLKRRSTMRRQLEYSDARSLPPHSELSWQAAARVGRRVSFTTVAMNCLAVAKFRKGTSRRAVQYHDVSMMERSSEASYW